MSSVNLDPICQCLAGIFMCPRDFFKGGILFQIGGRLTPTMAFLTCASLTRPTLNKLSTNSVLVEPEQYHAIERYLFVGVFRCIRVVTKFDLGMQSERLVYFFAESVCAWI